MTWWQGSWWCLILRILLTPKYPLCLDIFIHSLKFGSNKISPKDAVTDSHFRSSCPIFGSHSIQHFRDGETGHLSMHLLSWLVATTLFSLFHSSCSACPGTLFIRIELNKCCLNEWLILISEADYKGFGVDASVTGKPIDSWRWSIRSSCHSETVDEQTHFTSTD